MAAAWKRLGFEPESLSAHPASSVVTHMCGAALLRQGAHGPDDPGALPPLPGASRCVQVRGAPGVPLRPPCSPYGGGFGEEERKELSSLGKKKREKRNKMREK
ncbi:hypothetical protein PR202_ga12182 [Eleusine coracana subsp. coracana]|uniref:Uncharacterized protein n=1 Tax=Eleusine coracana subsp. coracana TaxID=191504 RepID=A0AAV5CBC9_ELECO|nr:hypothetical protein PR202_ga12182 [Eleusine coracana subsp. coracana]